mgnify:FL=1
MSICNCWCYKLEVVKLRAQGRLYWCFAMATSYIAANTNVCGFGGPDNSLPCHRIVEVASCTFVSCISALVKGHAEQENDHH